MVSDARPHRSGQLVVGQRHEVTVMVADGIGFGDGGSWLFSVEVIGGDVVGVADTGFVAGVKRPGRGEHEALGS